jgi:hypothetical protein
MMMPLTRSSSNIERCLETAVTIRRRLCHGADPALQNEGTALASY